MLKKAITSIVLSLILVLSPHAASASTKIVLSAVTLAKWKKVAVCEEGGNWKYFSYWYPDALGIDRPNYIQFGGNPNKPSSRAQQILVGQRFIKYYKMGVPDQYGCAPW